MGEDGSPGPPPFPFRSGPALGGPSVLHLQNAARCCAPWAQMLNVQSDPAVGTEPEDQQVKPQFLFHTARS